MHLSNKAKSSFLNKTLIPCTALRKNTQEKPNEKEKKDLQENFLNSGSNKGSRLLTNTDVKDQGKTNSTRHKTKIVPGAAYNQCFEGNNYPPQYEEECPVNYSLKYSETESCKNVSKNENTKEKFKDFSDYTETDLDQPTNFSLKYAENICCDEETKNSGFNYYDNEKENFKRYVDYAETDLDQPTDFALKYRESVDEDGKSLGFNYYGSDKSKASGCQGTRIEVEDTTSDQMGEHFACEDETPLMFSRCSSMNSLSSFVHITQSIPDDRSSIVSDFSRMTSGIISPSELPDSPTQTAPSSPKRVKPSICFPAKPDCLHKKSVFEDDVATYKLEDTPVEFSRATSLSSLNIENISKAEFVPKNNSGSLLPGKEEPNNSGDQVRAVQIKNQLLDEKPELEKEKLELTSLSEVDESLIGHVETEIKQKCSKSQISCNRLPEKNTYSFMSKISQGRTRHPDFLKPSPGVKFCSEPSKAFSPFEVSEDAVHTYCMEGTPANISHAGSHSDLSTLSMASEVQPSGMNDNSDAGSFSSEETDNMGNIKGKNCQSAINENNLLKVTVNKKLPSESKEIDVADRVSFISNHPRFDYLRKDPQIIVKDETTTFTTESSPCGFSTRSSFSDLTISVGDSPLCLNRNENREGQSSQTSSPLHNVSPQSPSSVTLGDLEDGDKVSEEEKVIDEKNDFYQEESSKSIPSQAGDNEENLKEIEEINSCMQITPDSPRVQTFDFYSSEPLTPFEEAILEECILLGMPQRNISEKIDEYKTKLQNEGKSENCKAKLPDSNAISNEKETKILAPSCDRTEPVGSSNENFDLDSSEPLTSFEEALLEQCIQLGMPQRKNLKNGDAASIKSSDDSGGENLNRESANITPLEAVLLEQCIRLGMSQKKNSKKNEESNAKTLDQYEETNKIISCVTAQLNKLKMSSETEKDSMKKMEHFLCICGRRHHARRKNSICKKSKKSKD